MAVAVETGHDAALPNGTDIRLSGGVTATARQRDLVIASLPLRPGDGRSSGSARRR
jgi:hypothetical protein